MRVRKIAKQFKLYYKNMTFDKDKDFPIIGYKVNNLHGKYDYIMRMTHRHYFGLRNKYPKGSMMWKYYTHKACAYELFDEIMEFWGVKKD
jgi:hypothetical protein